MSPAKPIECEQPTCLQEDRIDATESAIVALTREIAIVVERIGAQRDPISSRNGSGLIGAFEQLSAQFDEIKAQQARDMQSINAKLDAIQREQSARTEAPGKAIRWAVTILPLVAATIAAASWAMSHVRVMP